MGFNILSMNVTLITRIIDFINEQQAVIQALILLVLSATAILILWQAIIQKRLFKAQMLMDRLESYWRTYEPTSDEEVRELKLLYEDYINEDLYKEHYVNNEEKIRKYISLTHLYEYLAFIYKLKKLNIRDPIGYKWAEEWTKSLWQYKEFRDVHFSHKGFYPDFEKFINKEIQKKERNLQK